jgi:hypothetical protein
MTRPKKPRLAIRPKNSLYVHDSRSHADGGCRRDAIASHTLYPHLAVHCITAQRATGDCISWSVSGISTALLLTILLCDRTISQSTMAISSRPNRAPRHLEVVPSPSRVTARHAQTRKSDKGAPEALRLVVHRARSKVALVRRLVVARTGGNAAHDETRNLP